MELDLKNISDPIVRRNFQILATGKSEIPVGSVAPGANTNTSFYIDEELGRLYIKGKRWYYIPMDTM